MAYTWSVRKEIEYTCRTVVHNGLIARTIPAVDLDTATALTKRADIRLDGGLGAQLISHQVALIVSHCRLKSH